MRVALVIITTSVLLLNCTRHVAKNNPAGNPNNCVELAKRLIKTSSYTNIVGIKGEDLFVEDITDGVIRVHVTHNNEEGHNVTLGWLEIDLEKGLIRDVTINPDSPIIIEHYDKNLFNRLKVNCR